MELPQLDLDLCRERQKRLLTILENVGADRAVLTKREQVQYFTGFRPHHLMSAVICVDANDCHLIAPNEKPTRHAASKVSTFEAQWRCASTTGSGTRGSRSDPRRVDGLRGG